MNEYTAHCNLRTFWGHFMLAERKKIFGLLVSRLTGQKASYNSDRAKIDEKKRQAATSPSPQHLASGEASEPGSWGTWPHGQEQKLLLLTAVSDRPSIKSTLGRIQMTLEMLTATENKAGFWAVKLFLRTGIVSYWTGNISMAFNPTLRIIIIIIIIINNDNKNN